MPIFGPPNPVTLRTSTLTTRLPSVRGGFGLAVALSALALAGCAGVPEQVTSVFSASPGKYNFYTCDNIEPLIRAYTARRIELEQLMARASQDSGGAFVSAIAYRTEYEQAGSELQELARASADKQCAVGSKFSSGRAVF